MILAINRFNTSQTTQSKGRTPYAKNNGPAQDTFQPQKSFDPAFGRIERVKTLKIWNDLYIKFTLFNSIIPKDEIFKQCNVFLKTLNKVSSEEKLEEVSKDFYYHKLQPILDVDDKRNIINGKSFKSWFRHELVNGILKTTRMLEMMSADFGNNTKTFITEKHPEINTDSKYVSFLKNEFKENVNVIKDCTKRWSVVEKWGDNPNLMLPFKNVDKELMETIKRLPKEQIEIVGKELIKNKSVRNPAQFYNLFSQPLLNAVKHGDGKPFKVIIEEIIEKGKTNYYASFINPKTKAISESDINELIKGEGHRDSNAKEAKIPGTGLGISEVVRILRENGREKDIQNLFERGRTEGVCVRIPLIGIQ